MKYFIFLFTAFALPLALRAQTSCSSNRECFYNCCYAETHVCSYGPSRLDCIGYLTQAELLIIIVFGLIGTFLVLVLVLIAVNKLLKRHYLRKFNRFNREYESKQMKLVQEQFREAEENF